jgi:hypothetical protein
MNAQSGESKVVQLLVGKRAVHLIAVSCRCVATTTAEPLVYVALCMVSWLADWRQKMLEQKKIDMETFGGLGGVRHHSFGRGRGGGRGGGTGVPTPGRGAPPPAGSHRPGSGVPTGGRVGGQQQLLGRL